MIYTVTFNPSLDYVIHVGEFNPGNLHRAEAEELIIGGKGINVSAVLKELGIESMALGFVAGFTGSEIINRLNSLGISSDFVKLDQGLSRINVKLIDGMSKETEVNGQGPAINTRELEELFSRLESIKEGDFLILSGSVPGDIPDRNYTYAKICDLLKEKKVNIIVDAEDQLLLNTLPYKPFLIKPNHHELGRIFGRELVNEEDIIECARALQLKGAKNVLVSLAGQGAILIDIRNEVIKQKAPQGEIINSVGAGDAMVAGFITGLQQNGLKDELSKEPDNNMRDGLCNELSNESDNKIHYKLHDKLHNKLSNESDNKSHDRLHNELSNESDNKLQDGLHKALAYSIATGSTSAFSSGYPKRQLVEEIYRSIISRC